MTQCSTDVYVYTTAANPPTTQFITMTSTASASLFGAIDLDIAPPDLTP